MAGKRAHIELAIIADRRNLSLRDMLSHQGWNGVIACHHPEIVDKKRDPEESGQKEENGDG